MKKYRYFILSIIWIVVAIANYIAERALKGVILNVLVAVTLLSIGIMEIIFDKKGEREKFNKILKVYVIALAIALITVIGMSFVPRPDGITVESREEMLEDLPRGLGWKISTETRVGNNIISGIYSRDNKSGIAVFVPNGDKRYRLLARQWCDSDDIIISNFVIDNEWYDIVWFNGAKTDYAEITYTYDGKMQEPIIHNSKDMEIFVNPAPSNDYSLKVVYYDEYGNTYE